MVVLERKRAVEIKELLDLLMRIRPNGIEVDAYPQVVELLVNYTILQLTKKEV